MNILEAMDDPALFASGFRSPGTFTAWRAFMKALFALPMSGEELDIYRACTGRQEPPSAPVTEAWVPTGRRGGKSRVLALVGTFLAVMRDYRPYLDSGERATVMVLAADRKQARVIFRYVRGLLFGSPMLAKMVVRETSEELELSNDVVIEIATASHKTTRGYTLAAVLCDEVAFWPHDEHGAESDADILRALRPSMATIPGSVLLAASSPYARRGELWNAYRRWYGVEGAPLVWKAPTSVMNPTIPQADIDAAYEADAASAAAEFGAEFRTDVELLFRREAVEAVVIDGRHELPSTSDCRYFGFVDPSGGSADAMTLAVAHRAADGTVVLDAVRERVPPFSPESVVKEFAATLKSYGLSRVVGDRYAAEWPKERFREHGIEYAVSDKVRSDLYRDVLPIINSGKAELLDHPKIVGQFCGLERRTARGGKDSIDHAPGQHDDLANAVAGALVGVGEQVPGMGDVPIEAYEAAIARAQQPGPGWRPQYPRYR